MAGMSLAMVPLWWPEVPTWWPAAAAFMVMALWVIAMASLRGQPAALARIPGVLEVAAMVLLLVGGFFLMAGWLVGCVALWVSPRWRWTDKLLGTLVWPGGLVPVWFVFSVAPSLLNEATGLTAWIVLTALVLLLGAPLAVTARLWRNVAAVDQAGRADGGKAGSANRGPG